MSDPNECYEKPDPCPGCIPPMQGMCKVCLFMDAYKYDGCCYVSCDPCGCPKIVIFMRRNDALNLVKNCQARFVDDDEELECTPCGSCCERASLEAAA